MVVSPQLVGVVSRGRRGRRPAYGDARLDAAGAVAWGALPALSLVGALGLLAVAGAYTGARVGAAWATPLFWAGLLVLFVPGAARLITPGAARAERLGLVALLGLGLYLVKVLHSPLAFTYHDEFLHWRTASDLLQDGRLFGANPLLPASPVYPGLENVTGALVALGGLTIFQAGVVVVGAARLVLALALFLFYEVVGGSARVAGIATFLYMANPNFVFFNAQFSYESLALPFAILVLCALARRTGAEDCGALTGVAILGLGATIVTHHVTTYALVAFLVLWSAVAHFRRGAGAEQVDPAGLALLALVASLAWLVYAASLTLGYLAPHLTSGVRELLRIIAGEEAGRQLFRPYAGQANPPWERLIGLAAVGLPLLGLPWGLRQVWRRRRADAFALTLAAGALAYPAGLALRLTQFGAEASSRTAAFLFVALAFVLALGVAEAWRRWPRPSTAAACAGLAAVMLVGGVIVNTGSSARLLPGAYLVAADARSIEPQGVAAAAWARRALGPGHRFAADRTNRLLLGSYGEQYVVNGLADRVGVSWVFFSSAFGPAERAALRQARVRYLLIDRRLSDGLPLVGFYFESGEPGTFQHTTPLDPTALAKFDVQERVSRVFDSGDVVIYDLGTVTDEP
jgi:hypothetical protein